MIVSLYMSSKAALMTSLKTAGCPPCSLINFPAASLVSKEAAGKSGKFSDPIVTEITPASIFYPAEDYHQEYFAQHPNQPYCRAVVSPKVVKFRAKFNQLLKS